MSTSSLPFSASETRQQRIDTIMEQLRPKIDAAVRQVVAGKLVWRAGKKGYVACIVTFHYCDYAAKFHSYQQRRLLTVHGEVAFRRAYCCGRCRASTVLRCMEASGERLRAQQ